MIKALLFYPNELLKTKSSEVEDFTEPSFLELIDSLRATSLFHNAHGLAAVQIGVPKRAFVLNTDGTPKFYVNPTYVETQGTMSWTEGCLSFPGVEQSISRHASITVKAFDEKGEAFTETLIGLNAVAFQHEYDHLDGIVFTDRVSRLKRRMMLKRMNKLRKQGRVTL